MEIAPNDAEVLWMAAFAVWNMADVGRDRAADLFGRSLLVNPNSAMALSFAGWIETMRGHAAAGRELLERARQLSSRDPHGWISAGALAVAAIAEGDFPQLIGWGREGARAEPAARGRPAGARGGRGQRRPPRPGAARGRLVAGGRAAVVDLRILRADPFPVRGVARTYAEGLAAAGLPERIACESAIRPAQK